MDIKEKILLHLNDSNTPPQTVHDILAYLQITNKKERRFAFDMIRELEEQSEIFANRKNKFTTPEKLGMFKGIYGVAGVSGGGIVRGENFNFFIPGRYANDSLPGDTVLVRKKGEGTGGKRVEGEVVRILERFDGIYTGTLKNNGKKFEFFPDKMRFPTRIMVPVSKANGAKNGYKVTLKLFGEARRDTICNGIVVKSFGDATTVNANYLSILDDHNIKMEFSEAALNQAKVAFLNPGIEKELLKRRDLREQLIFTIDGADAKDLDDAISIEKNGDEYTLGVHIADVSHYVTHNSPLDIEAIERGTSVYFADKVVPMLPTELSNGICSLTPDEDKLALSCVIKIDKSGEIKSYEIFESVIRSEKKGVYNEINKVFDKTADDELIKEYHKLIPSLYIMRELAQILFNKRKARGALDFELSESKVLLDENNKVTAIVKRESGETQKLIEDFMLCANEAVATYAFKLQAPFVYRIHEEPGAQKVAAFLKISAVLGYAAKGIPTTLNSNELQKIIKHFTGTPYERMISTLALRSLMKAKYSPNCIGHYGLATKMYCHFTSPIRRYPDLVCHRILKLLINGTKSVALEKNYRDFVSTASISSTECEIKAMKAERDIEDLFKSEYMSYHVGEEFDGVISSVTSFGFYVELENTVEGLIRIASLQDDYYDFIEERLCFIGSNTKKTYTIGKKVRILVAKADITTSQIDFDLVEE